MTPALLILGLIGVLVVAAAALEAYFKGQTRKPLAQSQPGNVAKRALGQEATTTSIFQDLLEHRPRREAQTQKDTRR